LDAGGFEVEVRVTLIGSSERLLVDVAVDHFFELATVMARDRLLIGRVVEVDGDENAGWVMIPVGRLQLVAEAI
jgi:hypothetical protein